MTEPDQGKDHDHDDFCDVGAHRRPPGPDSVETWEDPGCVSPARRVGESEVWAERRPGGQVRIAADWRPMGPAEAAALALQVLELTALLGVPRPRPAED